MSLPETGFRRTDQTNLPEGVGGHRAACAGSAGDPPKEAAVRERKKAVGESVRIDDPFHLGIESEQ